MILQTITDVGPHALRQGCTRRALLSRRGIQPLLLPALTFIHIELSEPSTGPSSKSSASPTCSSRTSAPSASFVFLSVTARTFRYFLEPGVSMPDLRVHQPSALSPSTRHLRRRAPRSTE